MINNKVNATIFLVILFLLPGISFANRVTANQDLQRAIDELEAAKVYIQQAREQSPPNQRVVFHYDWVLSDINKIEGNIERKFDATKIQPRRLSSLKDDYLSVVGKANKG